MTENQQDLYPCHSVGEGPGCDMYNTVHCSKDCAIFVTQLVFSRPETKLQADFHAVRKEHPDDGAWFIGSNRSLPIPQTRRLLLGRAQPRSLMDTHGLITVTRID